MRSVLRPATLAQREIAGRCASAPTIASVEPFEDGLIAASAGPGGNGRRRVQFLQHVASRYSRIGLRGQAKWASTTGSRR